MSELVHFDPLSSVEEQLLLHDVVLLVDAADIASRVLHHDLPPLKGLDLPGEPVLERLQHHADLELLLLVAGQQEDAPHPAQVDLVILVHRLLSLQGYLFYISYNVRLERSGVMERSSMYEFLSKSEI